MALRMVYKSQGITGTDIYIYIYMHTCVSELLTRSVLKSLYDPNKHKTLVYVLNKVF